MASSMWSVERDIPCRCWEVFLASGTRVAGMKWKIPVWFYVTAKWLRDHGVIRPEPTFLRDFALACLITNSNLPRRISSNSFEVREGIAA